MKNRLLLFMAAAAVAVACNPPEAKKYRAIVSGTITVADSLDPGGDYSGTEFIVLYRDTSAVADTLMRAATNRRGEFRGMVRFARQGRYPVEIRRYQRIISSASLLLGPGDTISVKAELPGYVQTAVVSSGEQKTFDTYQRLNKNYDRLMSLAAAGRLKPDTLPDLARTWSNLYWELFQQHPGHYAGKLSAAESARLLNGLGDSLVLERVQQFKKVDMLGQVAGLLGAPALARTAGLDGAVAFLDELERYHPDREDRGSFLRLKVEMLADSGRIEEARNALSANKKLSDSWKEFAFWSETMEVDLTRLAPGQPAPDFNVVAGTDTVTLGSFKNRPVLIEFAALANAGYQNQYDRIAAVNMLFARTGFTILSIPVDANPVLYEGFFQERARQWVFTNPGEFQRSGIGDLYNVRTVPIRVLVGKDGRIVRKYTGPNIELLIKDLQNQSVQEPAS